MDLLRAIAGGVIGGLFFASIYLGVVLLLIYAEEKQRTENSN